jgi:tetratricopeptide (TPR) repeat protein
VPRRKAQLAKADPNNAGWQFNLGISHERISDVLKAQGDLAAALKEYEARRAIIERLAKAEPNNAGWQHHLSVSSERVGDVLVAQGNLADALKSFRDGLAIRLWKRPVQYPHGFRVSAAACGLKCCRIWIERRLGTRPDASLAGT